MRILSARIFLSLLAGKLKNFQGKYLQKQYCWKNKRRMRILSARIFLSLLAGKLKAFKQMLQSWNKSQAETLKFRNFREIETRQLDCEH